MSLTLDLTKALELNLEKAQIFDVPTFQVRMAADCSGSMSGVFANGWLNRVTGFFITAAMKFDDNGKLEMGAFNTEDFELQDAVPADIEGDYVKRVGLRSFGGTTLAPTLKRMLQQPEQEGYAKEPKGFFESFKIMFGGKKDAPIYPTEGLDPIYLAVLTDGQFDRSDKNDIEYVLERNPEAFIQFIGLGSAEVEYLQHLANEYRNVSFFYVNENEKLDANSFFEKLCNEDFKSWIEFIKG